MLTTHSRSAYVLCGRPANAWDDLMGRQLWCCVALLAASETLAETSLAWHLVLVSRNSPSLPLLDTPYLTEHIFHLARLLQESCDHSRNDRLCFTSTFNPDASRHGQHISSIYLLQSASASTSMHVEYVGVGETC